LHVEYRIGRSYLRPLGDALADGPRGAIIAGGVEAALLPTMDGYVHDGGVVVEGLLRPIPMMDVPVEDEDLLGPKMLLRYLRCNNLRIQG
jgi:hypothetical protein